MSTRYPIPENEAERLDALRALTVLDTPSEQAYDLVTACVAQVFDVPIALVSLIDENRQWFKSCIGLDARETHRDMAFCAHAIMRSDVLCVPDASADQRFANNPLVTGTPYIRFYAGAPLVTRDGYRLGTLCLIDTKPRAAFDERSEVILKAFAAMVVERLEAKSPRSEREEDTLMLKQAKVAAERADASKREFLAMVSHELRTPLNAILGFSGIITNEIFGPIEPPVYRDYIASIQESGEHLQGMIETILEFSAAEDGVLKVEESEFAIGEVVDKCLRLLTEKAQRFHVSAGASPMYGLPHLRADHSHVTQILLNVIGNAIKFNRPNGTVNVRAEACDSGFKIYVTDSGIGISSDKIDRLEAPFAQIDSRLARQHEGIGLGLAITRRLLELHGGRLVIQSREGEGSCVILEFPRNRISTELATEHVALLQPDVQC